MCTARKLTDPGARRRRRARAWFNLAWGLVQIMVVVVSFFAGGVAAGYLAVDVIQPLSPTTTDIMAETGLAAGVIAGLMINHYSRHWLQRWQRHRLRSRGVQVMATVTDLGHAVAYNPRGPNTSRYTLQLRWTDPQSGLACRGEMLYRFLGNKSTAFESACTGTVAIWLDASRSGRFVVDIPFAPAMADLVLGRWVTDPAH